MARIRNIGDNETNKTWSFKSDFLESKTRNIFLTYDKKVDEQVRVVLQTNETSSLEILEFTEDEKLHCRKWCPQENRMDEEFDFKQISSCLYTKNYLCIGYSNGSVRQYNFENLETTNDESGKKDATNEEIDDNYYNTMFGDSQEDQDSERGNKFWMDNPNIKKLNSKLLMKRMGYPICIRERNGMIYVLYDDGALMSTVARNSGSKGGYKVIRYEENFQGGVHFSINTGGDKIAVSTSNRNLIVCALERREFGGIEDDGIRSCKKILELPLFKKTNFIENNKKSENKFNCLNIEWSNCGKFIFVPGEPDIRVISLDDPKNVRSFRSEIGSDGTRSDICIVKELEYHEKLRLLASLNLEGELRVYLVELEFKQIKQLFSTFIEKNLKKRFPTSMDILLKNDKLEDEEVNRFLYITSILNTGELFLNKIRLDTNPYTEVVLASKSEYEKPSKLCVDEKMYSNQSGNSKGSDSDDVEMNQSENLLWEDASEVEDEEKLEEEDQDDEEEKERKEIYRRIKRSGVEDSDSGSERDEFGEDFETGDEVEEEEYEYESWDKKEFGRHIQYLKGKIERLRSEINRSNESQIPVIPGCTGGADVTDSLNEEKREFLFCWNQSGYISYTVDEEGRPSIDMECYNSLDGPKKLRVYDTKGYSMASIGMDGYVLGRKAKVLENGTFIPSFIEYHIWRTWGRNDKSGWTKTMLVGEDLVCMTCSRDFVAVMTSLRYLRIWRNSGLSISVTKLVGSPVCCVSNESYLLVITQKEPFYVPNEKMIQLSKFSRDGVVTGRCNTYEILFLDISRETLIYNDVMSITPETVIKWCGVSKNGIPVIQDTSGQAFMLARQWKNQKENWVPITNFGTLESNSSSKYFILGINDDHFNVLKLPDGLDDPIPLMAKNSANYEYSTIKIPINIPILGLPSIRQWMNIIENDKALNECITNNSIPWEVIDELRLKLELKQSNIRLLSDNYSYEKELKQYRLNREKLLMRLYMKLVIKQLVEPAFDVVKMFSFPKSFQIALEQAEKSGERILANKIGQEIQIRSRFEQEGGLLGGIEQKNKRDPDKTPQETRKSRLNSDLSPEAPSKTGQGEERPDDQAKKMEVGSMTKPSSTLAQLSSHFNIKPKSGKASWKSSSGQDNEEDSEAITGGMNENTKINEDITRTVQYCSEIIKKRKV
ncbi:WD40 repeat-containing protein [Cryptosporidium felis]|nr:WD40 repeat-containing protein [Cryptosporidium felis]